MGFAYLLHQSSIWSNVPDGSRNCRIFLVAWWIYLSIYLILTNTSQLRNVGTFIFMGMCVDFVVCAVIYKTYYGRSILHENIIDDDNNWNYHTDEHKYIPKSNTELNHIHQEQVNEFTEQQASKIKTKNILHNKQCIHAATIIQRWWHKILYEPPGGILFLREQEAFYTNDE